MGSNSRYDRDRQVDDREAAEARALHVIADLVESRHRQEPASVSESKLLRRTIQPAEKPIEDQVEQA